MLLPLLLLQNERKEISPRAPPPPRTHPRTALLPALPELPQSPALPGISASRLQGSSVPRAPSGSAPPHRPHSARQRGSCITPELPRLGPPTPPHSRAAEEGKPQARGCGHGRAGSAGTEQLTERRRKAAPNLRRRTAGGCSPELTECLRCSAHGSPRPRHLRTDTPQKAPTIQPHKPKHGSAAAGAASYLPPNPPAAYFLSS